MPHTRDPSALSPEEALARLTEGNRRFRTGEGFPSGRAWSAQQAREAQRPFAIVLGCSDSRTPVEILFDQGFGELFVVRIAGNIVAPSVVGSIEFAASQFGTRLVVVLGHTRCGAIAATLSAVETGLGPGVAEHPLHHRADRPAPRGARPLGLAQGAGPRGDARQRARLGRPPAPRQPDHRGAGARRDGWR